MERSWDGFRTRITLVALRGNGGTSESVARVEIQMKHRGFLETLAGGNDLAGLYTSKWFWPRGERVHGYLFLVACYLVQSRR